ncbi:MAG TPA: hypothetical protein DDX71_05240 [Ruminococcus sp.]|nr:hypothetical protein [Ruminococcus sp.]
MSAFYADLPRKIAQYHFFAEDWSVTMDQPNVLRTTKIGGGFVKEDVLAYVDELNSQIYALQEERDELKKRNASGGGLDESAQAQYEAELTRLRGELGTTKNQLRAAQDELKNRPVIDGGEGGISPAELEAARQEATDAKADLAAVQAELQVAQEEAAETSTKITELEARIESLNEDNLALRSDLAEAAAQALTAGGNEEAAAKVAALQSQVSDAEAKVSVLQEQLNVSEAELASLRSELDAKNAMIEEQAGLSNEQDLQKLAVYEAQIAEQNSTLADKEREIESLQQQVADLKENSADSSFDMGSLFAEAQKTANKVVNEARQKAEQRVKDATTQAETILSEATAKAEEAVQSANKQAEQTIADANKQADETISNANAEAEKKINDADAQAVKTVADAEETARASLAEAEKRNKTTSETARTVRALLRSEIDSVSKKFNEISLVLENLTGQASSRLNEAKNVITEARGTVNDDDELPNFDSFDEVANKAFGGKEKGEFSFDDLAESAGENSGSWS